MEPTPQLQFPSSSSFSEEKKKKKLKANLISHPELNPDGPSRLGTSSSSVLIFCRLSFSLLFLSFFPAGIERADDRELGDNRSVSLAFYLIALEEGFLLLLLFSFPGVSVSLPLDRYPSTLFFLAALDNFSFHRGIEDRRRSKSLIVAIVFSLSILLCCCCCAKKLLAVEADRELRQPGSPVQWSEPTNRLFSLKGLHWR